MTLPTSLRAQTFVTAAELADLVATDRPPIILDVRDPKAAADGPSGYRSGHIPRAVFVDLSSELQGQKEGFSGSRPVPDIAELQERARAWGVHDGDAVIVYDETFGTRAGRAWWILRWAGINSVRLLDGGYGAWLAGGHPVSTEQPALVKGNVTLSPGNLPALDADAAAMHAVQGSLFDARSRRQYEAGHIPGATLASTRGNLTDDGLLADEETLRGRFAELGIEGDAPIGVYCGGSASAAHEVAVLTSLGIPAELFVGSFSAWSSDPSRPIVTGESPRS